MDMHRLRPEDLDFLASAPVRLDFDAAVGAGPERVFAAISADPSTWTWFPGLDEGRYESAPPHGVGSTRAVRLGDDVYRETLLAWDAPSRWAYRVDETSSPFFDALVEDWRIEPVAGGDGSVVRWTFAIAPRADVEPLLADASEVIGSAFGTAMEQLDARLTRE